MKKNKKTINAKIAKAVKMFFFLIFLSVVIIRFYLLKKVQISEINIKYIIILKLQWNSSIQIIKIQFHVNQSRNIKKSKLIYKIYLK